MGLEVLVPLLKSSTDILSFEISMNVVENVLVLVGELLDVCDGLLEGLQEGVSVDLHKLHL